MDDALALEALLELSQCLSAGNEVIRLEDKKFPLLDEPTVLSAVEGVAFIIEKKHKLRRQSVDLLKKWCDVREGGLSGHWTWTGRGLSRLDTLDCLLAACEVLLDEKSIRKTWQCLELQQQQALCLAMICSAEDCERARKLSVKLFELIVSQRTCIINHLEFMDKIWSLRALLGLSTKHAELLVQNSPHGLEKQLIAVAQETISKNSYESDIWQRVENNSLIVLCSASPVIFQVSTSILLQLVLRSQAHQNILELMTDFATKCAPTEQDTMRLYPAKCQLALALLSVSPEASDGTNYADYLIDEMRALPRSMAILLLVLNPKWMPVIADKL